MSTLLPSNSSQALCEGILAENGLLSGHLFRRVLTDPNMRSSFNPDVLGFGVRLVSILITNICAGILMIFGSREEKRTAIQNTAIQNIIMLLGTLISLSRGQLSFYDGLFALLVVHSPLLVYSAFYGFYTYYSRGGEKAALVSSLLIVLLSLSLDWVVYKARELGATCDSLTLKHYLL
ncbi:hypothetical protein C8F04DRAFT_1256479 [Mycena alexandri]|uniref:Uncharacterized protein n=1 Tax=Mycena alexandri TaxID=1745969 RepID=A0AAD6T1H1_9AGAR|nr:hypothetical protein C8F04DRAFT_1256479 [Mycena alexandri]